MQSYREWRCNQCYDTSDQLASLDIAPFSYLLSYAIQHISQYCCPSLMNVIAEDIGIGFAQLNIG